MALEEFHLFQLLPFDLRRDIYILATPPRVVHIQEELSMDEEEFKDKLRTKINLHPDPDLAYFAPNWRRVIRPINKQSTLESFGVASGRKPYQPWEPSASTPEIPPSWLEENPDIAWQLIRDNSLWSNAPIPGLLHAYSESRRVLMRHGYKLAFRTRSNGPRTWFHFDRDVLFIDRVDEYGLGYFEDILTQCPWNSLGQFHSEDLRRVKKLALGQSESLLFSCERCGQLYSTLVNAIQLFPNLEELQIVQWNEEDLFSWRNYGNGASHPWFTDEGVRDKQCGALCSLAAEEVDALLPLLSYHDGFRTDMSIAGPMGKMLRLHLQQPGNKLGFIEHQQWQAEQTLSAIREEKLRRNHNDKNETNLSAFVWQVPRVRAAHIIYPSMASQLIQERQLGYEKILKMKRNHRPTETQRENTIADMPLRAHPGAWWGNEVNSASNVFYQNERKFWVEEGVIPPPGKSVFL
ncbi:hypothetical protein BJX61DRAFT_339960 [Aspergillus egyptiacus]|nr:hypothetical protein BJX61DRAFT_339960 [Aspergillus egyptiacus]